MLKLIGATATLGIGMPLAFSFMPKEVCEEKKLVRPVDLPIYESIHEVKIGLKEALPRTNVKPEQEYFEEEVKHEF